MEGWQIGLIAVLVVGLTAIIYGAIRDRWTNDRRRREMLSPPHRDIPRFAPDSPTPNYLSDLQARRPPSNAKSTELSADERADLQAAISSPDVTAIATGYASHDLVTDTTTRWSVLRQPNVLVSNEPVTTIRELIGVLERQLPTGRPMVVVAPEISKELIQTFEVNHIQQILTVLPIVIPEDPSMLVRIAEATGATPMSRTDLQSGYVAPDLLGSCATWLATPDCSYLLADAAHSTT